MLRLGADENLNNDIIRGLQRRLPTIDLVRVQDVGLSGADDAQVLLWAATEQRVLVTQDVATITDHAYQRVRRGDPMPGVIEIARTVALRQAIDDLLLLAECSEPGEWDGRVIYLPL